MDELHNQTPESIHLQIRVHGYLHFLAVAILYYDHLLTLKLEVAHLWARPKTPSAHWFFMNRYFAFWTNLVVLVLANVNLENAYHVPYSSEVYSSDYIHSCRKYTLFRQVILIINQVLIGVLLTLRIYALYNRSKAHLTYMVGSGAVLAGVACYVMFGQKGKVAEGDGCHTGLSKETAYRLAGAWEALFVYDTILFALTLYKTLKERKDHRITGININLISLILRDGCMYFALMALCNLANIMTFYFCPPYLRGGLSTFASCVSVTVMSRMMLNLHQTADEGIYSTTKTNTHFDYYTQGGETNRVELDTIWSGDPPTNRTYDTSYIDSDPPGMDSTGYGTTSNGSGRTRSRYGHELSIERR